MTKGVRVLLLLCVLPAVVAAAQTNNYSDNSDWWSQLRTVSAPDRPKLKPQKRIPSEKNYQLLGITLGADASKIKAILGQVQEVTRGDAATGRTQWCYKSQDGAVHLIFEEGEVDEIFYLFEGGRTWNGEELCAVSAAVSKELATASGLHLGMSPEKMDAILGTPSLWRADKRIYWFEYTKKEPGGTDPAEYMVDVYIEAHFTRGKLSYLTVSRAEVD